MSETRSGGAPPDPETDPSSLLSVRLSPDAQRLEVLLLAETAVTPLDWLAALLRRQCTQLGVELPEAEAVEDRLRTARHGLWVTLFSGTPSTPPIDGRVELLVPVPVVARENVAPGAPASAAFAGLPLLWGARHAVLAGTPLARLHRGSAGTVGRDLLGRAIAPRLPRQARLPQGHNTIVSEDGTTLLASCDGEVRLRQLLIDVIPMRVHKGDLRDDETLLAQEGIFITGSVRRARVRAWGDVYVQGDAVEAEIESEGSSVAIAGRVIGSESRRCIVRAGADVTCGAVDGAEIHAGGSIYLTAEARHSVLHAGGDLHTRSVEQSLDDIQLRLGGGLVPSDEGQAPLITVPSDRQHVRVAVIHDAWISLHGSGPLRFDRCTVVDLSTGGARCRVKGFEPRPGAVVQLKFDLPDGQDQVLAIARTSRWIAPGVVGVAFLQMTRRDQHRLKLYCVRVLLERGQHTLASRSDRRRG